MKGWNIHSTQSSNFGERSEVQRNLLLNTGNHTEDRKGLTISWSKKFWESRTVLNSRDSMWLLKWIGHWWNSEQCICNFPTTENRIRPVLVNSLETFSIRGWEGWNKYVLRSEVVVDGIKWWLLLLCDYFHPWWIHKDNPPKKTYKPPESDTPITDPRTQSVDNPRAHTSVHHSSPRLGSSWSPPEQIHPRVINFVFEIMCLVFPKTRMDSIYCNKWKWYSMSFTTISDNDKMIDCNKWHLNRFLNRFLIQVINSLLLTGTSWFRFMEGDGVCSKYYTCCFHLYWKQQLISPVFPIR